MPRRLPARHRYGRSERRATTAIQVTAIRSRSATASRPVSSDRTMLGMAVMVPSTRTIRSIEASTPARHARVSAISGSGVTATQDRNLSSRLTPSAVRPVYDIPSRGRVPDTQRWSEGKLDDRSRSIRGARLMAGGLAEARALEHADGSRSAHSRTDASSLDGIDDRNHDGPRQRQGDV